MDGDHAWIVDALQGILPEQTLRLLHDHVLHPTGTLATLRAYLSAAMSHATTQVLPLVEPVIDRCVVALQDSPDLVVLGFVLAFAVMALQAMMWVQRMVRFFTRLALRLVGWAIVAGIVAVVWQRGPEAAARDVVVIVSKLAGYAAVVKDIWWTEYQRYDAQTKGGPRPTGYSRAMRGVR